MSVTFLLLVAAFVCVIASALGKVPLWVGVLLALIAQMLGVLPR